MKANERRMRYVKYLSAFASFFILQRCLWALYSGSMTSLTQILTAFYLR